MKNEQELEDVVIKFSGGFLSDTTIVARIKLLRSIQIDALREAREIVDAIARHDAAALASLPELDKLIRELELK